MADSAFCNSELCIVSSISSSAKRNGSLRIMRREEIGEEEEEDAAEAEAELAAERVKIFPTRPPCE